ncbi:polysaccharide deacetylase family protein [Halomonas sp. McH1-25]|uniref:polysaccharide deacetylase family protein n=1 Tax=unclassified Halomonas TaxID=2609666 RepID=UPI001EF6A58C|nr:MULTISPECIES: polysaccharide deacetylase family protein [unclassified Halomonas]MCG7599968.1 polysaccharide deacetylase family protein [Halomonas sp. McH1-25]MCP1343379.1 polysaccharide deacetylase family protein [Halomonas sp. FL8]MCP1360464.1 polysaccharide deacetylase family protein [Halomonas sp. BBD45]MCP1363860.1 polysaccharide deacetylase family protein [Halomonas sp. BBD48]
MNGLDLAQDLAQRLRGHWRRSLAEPLWGRSAIIMLHRVLPSEQEARLPHRAPWCLGPESFERLLVALCDVARLVSLPTAMQAHHDPKARIALTFDAGWRDNADVAAPLLEHYAIPASIFVNTAWLGRPGGHWREVIGEGLWQAGNAQRIREAMGDAGLPLPPMPPSHPNDAYSRALLAYFMQLGQVNPQRLNMVAQQLCQELDQPHLGIDAFSMRRLESGGLVRFGARGVDFTAFEWQSDERIRWQVQRSRRTLARLCREPLPVLAYPDERPSARIQQVVQRCGIQAALAGDGGWLNHRSNPLALPRIAIAQPIAHSPGRLFDYLLGKL